MSSQSVSNNSSDFSSFEMSENVKLSDYSFSEGDFSTAFAWQARDLGTRAQDLGKRYVSTKDIQLQNSSKSTILESKTFPDAPVDKNFLSVPLFNVNKNFLTVASYNTRLITDQENLSNNNVACPSSKPNTNQRYRESYTRDSLGSIQRDGQNRVSILSQNDDSNLQNLSYETLSRNLDANLAEIDMDDFRSNDIHQLLTLPTVCHGCNVSCVTGSLFIYSYKIHISYLKITSRLIINVFTIEQPFMKPLVVSDYLFIYSYI